jgi:hypothetical protein
MEPNRELVNSRYWERVRRARAMTADEKFVAGPRLFQYACRITMDGIRRQHPEADGAEVHRILSQRLALRRRFEERGIYRPAGDAAGEFGY